jgi:hypothetical protein
MVILHTLFVAFNHYILMSLHLCVQIVDGIKNATTSQLDVTGSGSLQILFLRLIYSSIY